MANKRYLAVVEQPSALNPPASLLAFVLMLLLAPFVLILRTTAAEPLTDAVDFEPNLPLVFLEATQPIASDPKVPCTVQLAYPKGATVGETNRLSGLVRYHGASSQGYPKKSLSLTLDAPVELLDMRANTHWILNAAYVDRSLMRHKLSYDLFRALSTNGAGRFAAASRFVEVYLNGRYQGAFLLMERVDRRLLNLRAFSSNDMAHACIYKAVDHAANFSAPGHGGYEQREPDPLVKAYWKPLDDFNRFVSTTPDAEFFDPKNGIASRLDLDNAIDFHLLVLLTSNMDGITKNFILARDAPTNGTSQPRFFFAPWDYDGTFGRNWNATPVAPSAWLSNRLFNRLLGDAAYRARCARRWDQLCGGPFSAATVQAWIDDNARTLGAAAERNATRWPTTRGWYPDRLTFAQDLAEMKVWIDARVKWLTEEIHQRAR